MPSLRYIVRAKDNPAALTDFLSSTQGDPGIAVVDTIGPSGQPHTAVIEVAQDKGLALEERFRNSTQLIIERDRPLSPFG